MPTGPGNPPALRTRPTGCPFSTRGEVAAEVTGGRWRAELPDLAGASHLVRCHIPHEQRLTLAPTRTKATT